MIKTFACEETEKIWEGDMSRRFPVSIRQAARRKLRYLHFAINLDDLRSPPGNRLEKLKGSRKGEYSIRVNDQWRICFGWEGKDAFYVEITDYH